MDSKGFKRDNHYVPRSYLKRWASGSGKIWSYRVLVSRAEVPHWKRASTRGIAYHEHLYTRIASSGESDELERWLDTEFESPAEEVIERVVSDRRLSPADWRCLARFFAAQDLRTPARLLESLERWSQTMEPMLQDELERSVARFVSMSDQERTVQARKQLRDDKIPFRVAIEENPDGEGGRVKAETVAGRGLWLWGIQHMLTRSQGLRALQEHNWTILTPPDGLSWFTSDDPVLKLNFETPQSYDFGGGWGSTGTDLMLPLGPRHLLFTQVGHRVPPRGSQMDTARAHLVQRLIAEHAHRYIFSSTPDPMMSTLRPRAVNAAAVRDESAQWQRWHAEQSQAEQQLMGWSSGESHIT